MSQRATEETLASLHGALAAHFLERLASGEASTADLNAARQFLKDNSISCVAEENKDMQALSERLPDFVPYTTDCE